MFCVKCGSKLIETANFCNKCGTSTHIANEEGGAIMEAIGNVKVKGLDIIKNSSSKISNWVNRIKSSE